MKTFENSSLRDKTLRRRITSLPFSRQRRSIAPWSNDPVDARSEKAISSFRGYGKLLEEEADLAGIPPEVLQAVCWHASGWRHFDPNGAVLSTPTAHGTNWGCMQLNDVWHPDAFPAASGDSHASIRYGAQLLRWLFDQTNDWHRAVIAYFGHDRQAENSALRVERYARQKPWMEFVGQETLSVDDEKEYSVG